MKDDTIFTIFIQVLEDDVLIQDLLKGVFKLNGFSEDTQRYFSESELFIKALNEKVQICVLDHYSTPLNGLAVLEVIKSRFKKCQVIITSGQGSKDVVEDYLNAGANGYVDKNKKDYETLFVKLIQRAVEFIKEDIEDRKTLIELREMITTTTTRTERSKHFRERSETPPNHIETG